MSTLVTLLAPGADARLAEAYACFENAVPRLPVGPLMHGGLPPDERRALDGPPPTTDLDAARTSLVHDLGYSAERSRRTWSQAMAGALGGGVELRNILFYPAGGYMGWHTNSARPGWRLYFVRVAEPRRSFFRSREPDSGALATAWEDARQVNLFRVTPAERPHWHCIATETERWSAGFVVSDGLAERLLRLVQPVRGRG
jgi:hypothetical protein